MSKSIEKKSAAFQFLRNSSSKMIQIVINAAPTSLINAFSEIAFNAMQTRQTKLLKSLSFKKTTTTKKRKLLKPTVVKF